MGKKNSIIEINGSHYDAVTGAPIGHGQHLAVSVSHRAEPEKIIKPVASHQPKTTHQPAKNLRRHAPQRSTTLMRKAVRRPSTSHKRQIRVQVNTADLVEQPAAVVVPKLSFGNLDKRRLNRADSVKKSRLISHFSAKPISYDDAPTGVAPRPVQPTSKAAFQMKDAPQPADDPAISDRFEHAIEQATSHLEPQPKAHKKRRLHLTRKHAKHARA